MSYVEHLREGRHLEDIVDLSQRVEPGMQVYPGDPTVAFEAATTIAEDGVGVLALHLGTHSGTHVDAPGHFVEGGAGIDDLDLALFVGRAVIVDVRHRGARGAVRVPDISPYRERIAAGTIVVLRTGWNLHWGTPRYLDHPFLDAEAASYLLDAGVRTVATDALSVDETHPGGEGDFPAHHALLGAGGVIAENLTNLDAIRTPSPILSLLPIKLSGADGAPVRAVAFEPSWA